MRVAACIAACIAACTHTFHHRSTTVPPLHQPPPTTSQPAPLLSPATNQSPTPTPLHTPHPAEDVFTETGDKPLKDGSGLVAGHAYTLLTAKETSDGHKLVTITDHRLLIADH